MRKWTRRWISAQEINSRKNWKKRWEENPEKMRQALAVATETARRNKERRRNRLTELILAHPFKAGMTTQELMQSLFDFLRPHRKRITEKMVKALRIRLVRYGLLSFDAREGVWKLKVV